MRRHRKSAGHFALLSLPKDYELKESSDVAAFAQEITDALENAKLRYLVK